MDMRLFSIESDTGFLREAAALVDNRLDKLVHDAKTCPDPDGYGLIDSSEYIIGFGFVACQSAPFEFESEDYNSKGFNSHLSFIRSAITQFQFSLSG